MILKLIPEVVDKIDKFLFQDRNKTNFKISTININNFMDSYLTLNLKK